MSDDFILGKLSGTCKYCFAFITSSVYCCHLVAIVYEIGHTHIFSASVLKHVCVQKLPPVLKLYCECCGSVRTRTQVTTHVQMRLWLILPWFWRICLFCTFICIYSQKRIIDFVFSLLALTTWGQYIEMKLSESSCDHNACCCSQAGVHGGDWPKRHTGSSFTQRCSSTHPAKNSNDDNFQSWFVNSFVSV